MIFIHLQTFLLLCTYTQKMIIRWLIWYCYLIVYYIFQRSLLINRGPSPICRNQNIYTYHLYLYCIMWPYNASNVHTYIPGLPRLSKINWSVLKIDRCLLIYRRLFVYSDVFVICFLWYCLPVVYIGVGIEIGHKSISQGNRSSKCFRESISIQI